MTNTLILVIGTLVLCNLYVVSFGQTCNANYRIDCKIDSQQQCVARGCCWNPTSPVEPETLLNETSLKGVPWCFQTWKPTPGYKISSLVQTPTGLSAILQLYQGSAIYGQDVNVLRLDVFMETAYRLRVKITDPNNARWEVPGVVKTPTPSTKANTTDYAFSYTTQPFGFAVTRVSTGEVLFNTSLTINPTYNGLVFEDQYLEISTQLPSQYNVYGLGEHIRNLKLDQRVYTLWARDEATPTNKNLYGVHPFYLDLRPSGNAHGVFLLNSNGMDVILSSNSLTYKTIGGVLDFFFFLGPTPEDVIVQYNEVIGRPYFIPYWSLGFHQCRWGYHNLSEVRDVVTQYKANNIPLEAMWTDIDYMDRHRDFSFDPVNFPPAQMNSWVNELHQNNQHYILITDPGINNIQGYAPYDIGCQMDVWVKNSKGQYFVGEVWPGDTVFPDFLNPATADYWEQMISQFYQVAQFDGLWIDMNECDNFCDGECEQRRAQKRSAFVPTLSAFDPNNPPYTISNGGDQQDPLDKNTLDMDAVHYQNTLEYNVHSMYGMMEAIATSSALEKVRGKRAVVIGRSTFASSGHYGGHWTGDVTSAWSDLSYSIPDLLNFNMFGIPFIGADICGFNGNTTEELCARWIEVGAFYPFSRNHNSIGTIPQELYRWPQVASIGRDVLTIRYSLLPYYYTLFYQSHVGIGATVWRPLFFEFPKDSSVYGIDMQFMIGNGLMITPVVTQGATSVTCYFPAADWYDFFSLAPISNTGKPHTSTLNTPIDKINIHVRGGVIIPMQQPAYSIHDTLNNPYSLLVALPMTGNNNSASGELYLDDGDSLNTVEDGLYTYILFSAKYTSAGAGKLTSTVVSNGYSDASTKMLSAVTVLGVTSPVHSVTVNGVSASYRYHSSKFTLVVSGITIPINKPLSIVWN